MKKVLALLIAAVLGLVLQLRAEEVPAFPGAEGFGRYVTGGRGGTVYHVTTLEDADVPTKGMLRWALNQKGPRIIVFDVAGTIFLTSTLNLTNDDVTIAGQTAPGDGICIADYPFQIRANNVIIRYVRFRMGNRHVDQHEGDGLGAMDKNNIIVDHCTISWSVDECCSIYGGSNLTVQWCIIAQSMVNSGHSKGAHGYGGNWGGSGCTYAHNLLLHHTSRTPRLGPRPGTQCDERLDMRNNVIYNWGGNGCYGGEGMNVNIVNNYYKPGPATRKRSSGIQRRIAAPGIRTTSYCQNSDGSWNQWYPMWHVWGHYYVEGNVNPSYADVTADNWTLGVANQIDTNGNDGTATATTKDTIHARTPLHFPYITTWSAEEAYSKVLDYAGCLKPRQNVNGVSGWANHRDRLDSIMVNDTRNGVATFTGSGLDQGFINTQADVVDATHSDPWPTLTANETEIQRASKDSDMDGIPDYYEDLYWGGEDVNPKAQCTKTGFSQYTNMDYYLHMLVYARITRYINTEQGANYAGECEVLGDESGIYEWNSTEAIQSPVIRPKDNDQTIRDLQGRLVSKPVKGSVYIQGGKVVGY